MRYRAYLIIFQNDEIYDLRKNATSFYIQSVASRLEFDKGVNHVRSKLLLSSRSNLSLSC